MNLLHGELSAHRVWYVESVKLILYVELPTRHPRLIYSQRTVT